MTCLRLAKRGVGRACLPHREVSFLAAAPPNVCTLQVRRKGAALAAGRHAICAATLSTLPFDVRPDELEHRPRGMWWPVGTSALVAPGSQKKKKAAG